VYGWLLAAAAGAAEVAEIIAGTAAMPPAVVRARRALTRLLRIYRLPLCAEMITGMNDSSRTSGEPGAGCQARGTHHGPDTGPHPTVEALRFISACRMLGRLELSCRRSRSAWRPHRATKSLVAGFSERLDNTLRA
jgi:hypothetical protein